MAFALSRVLVAFAVCLGFTPASWAQQEEFRDQGGISSPLLSRCAGKFGSELREADNAFPLLTLMGAPWMTVERTDQTVEGQHIVAVVTGIGARNLRHGAVVGVRYRCLIDDKGAAVSFTVVSALISHVSEPSTRRPPKSRSAGSL